MKTREEVEEELRQMFLDMLRCQVDVPRDFDAVFLEHIEECLA